MHKFTKVTFKVLDVIMIFMMVFGAPMSALAAPQAQDAPPPTIQSDKADYSAGSLVTLTGTGWTGDTTVTIVVTDAAPTVYHDTDQVQVQADGTISDSFNLPTGFVDQYFVTATGAQTGRVATATFTDAPAQANLDQCRNGSGTPADHADCTSVTWQNGNLGAQQAHLLEGYSTPFRAVMTNIPANTSITLVIGYDIRNSSANAYDYLTQYQRLEPHAFFGHSAETVYPTDGVSGFSATTTTFPIPAPSSAGSPVAGQPTASFNLLPAAERVMTLFGGTLTGVAYVTQGSLTANQSETQIAVTFTSDNSTAVLAWGGHIAQCSVWGLDASGKCSSAGGISGSPYHMRLVSWTDHPANPKDELPNLGNTDRSMSASVVIQPGNLTLAKSLTGGPNGYTGPFTINYNCGPGYTGTVTVNAGSSQTVLGIPSGSVCTISETPPTPPTGYTFGTPTFSPANTVTIGQGTTVTVTTNNTLTRDLGSLKLSKSLTGGPSGYTGPFTLNYSCTDGTSGSVSVAAGSSQTVSGIPTGTSCTISEPNLPSAPSGYTFGTPSFSPSDTVTISSSTTVEVTTNNTLSLDTGSLKILKTLSNPDGASVPASFTINYDCGTGYTGSVSVAAGGSQTVSGIPTGSSCTVSEPALTPITGYTWGTPTVTGSPATIGKDTTVEVTVANSITRDLGSLVLAKSLTGGPSGYTGPFTINYDCGTGYTGSVSVAAGGSQTVSGIPTGSSCTVSETLPTPPTGYSFGTPTFSPSDTVTISAGSGSSVTVTTNNTLTRDTGTLTIAKTLSNPDGASVPASFTINYDCGTGYTGSVSVAAGGSQTVSGIPTGSTCTVSEAALTPIPGYTWGTPTVTPASVVIADTTGTFTLTVANSITRDRGSLTIAKTLSNPDGANVPASFTINYDCGLDTDGSTALTGSKNVAAGGTATVSGIPTGNSCSVTEVAPTPIPGYTWGTITYTPASVVIADTTSTFTITVGNSITRDHGSLEIKKTLSNPDGASVPASFSVDYDCGTGYTGQVSVAPGSPATVNGIPTGSVCTVTETTPTPIPGYTWGTITYTPASVTIDTKDQTFTITVGNSITKDRGTFTIAKALSNPDGANIPASFTINYDCGLDTDGSTALTGSKNVAAGGTATVSGIPTGNSCSVTEVAPTPIPGYTWGTITYTPASVVIADTTSTFTITVGNSITRDRGSFKITKTTSNPNGATLPAAFTGTYDCGTGYTGTWSVADGGSQIINDIPTGNTCTVTEDALAPISGYTWGTPTFTPTSIVISTKGQTFEIVVGNSITRDRGSFKITKQTSNPDGASLPASFTGTYDCGGGYSGSFSVANGASQTFGGIPTGSVCTVTETTPTPIPGYTWGIITYTPSSITISTKGGTFEIVVGNSITRDRGSLKIYKTLSNPDGASVPASFTVNYNCGTGYTGQVSVAPGSPATVNGIPTGNTCTVTEVAPTPIPNYTWGTITYTPASVTIDTKGQTFTITVGNSITRDRGTLTVVKKVINDNGGTATVSAFGINTTAGSLTFDSGTANGTTTTYTSQMMTVVTGTYTLKENDVYGYIEGTWSCVGAAGTVVPTFNNGSVVVGKNEDVTCTITNNDQPGTIIIKKITKPVNTGSFSFTTTGSGYNNFTIPGGGQNSQTLNAGTYTVTESTQLAWILTGIGQDPADPNNPLACAVSGSGGSTGTGNLNTMSATISLKNGDTVTCVFENTGQGVTRTQGFWATHTPLANIAWFGGTAFGHTFPGVAGTAGIGDKTLCGRQIDTLGKLMGGFWSDVSKTSTGKKRSALDQARMQLLQQLLAAELNASAFGSVPAGGSTMFAKWEAAYCGTDTKAISTAQSQAAAFNSAGDSGTFTPGTSADSKNARTVANYAFWDVLP